jgi:hypothetical protein
LVSNLNINYHQMKGITMAAKSQPKKSKAAPKKKTSKSAPKKAAVAKKPAPSKKTAKTASVKKSAPPKKPAKKATAKKSAPPQKARPAQASEGKAIPLEDFVSMTYLTANGAKEWLKRGRLTGSQDGSGQWMIDAANLEVPDVKRLLR